MSKFLAALALVAGLIFVTPLPASASGQSGGIRQNADQYEVSSRHRRWHRHRWHRAHWGPRRVYWGPRHYRPWPVYGYYRPHRVYWGPAWGVYRPWRPYWGPHWGWGHRPWGWGPHWGVGFYW